MQIIPFKEPGSWESQMTLSDVIYNLRFQWNALNEYWTMDIYSRNDDPILLGVKVVVNWNLTSQYIAVGMPLGDIVCQNILGLVQETQPNGSIEFVLSSQSFRKIERFSMGQTAELFYYEKDELRSLSS